MRILQIEDDTSTADSVELMLKASGFTVYTTDTGEEGVDLAKVYDYDLILVDNDLSDMTGLDVIRRLRFGEIHTPVIFLNGQDTVDTQVKAFAVGADDYLPKPFHRDVLVARIGAVIRRAKGYAEPVLTIGPMEVFTDEKRVKVGGRPVHLTGKEYQMVELLALRKGVTLTKEVFMNHLYGGLDEPELKIIDVFICKLRKKLAAAGGKGLIDTVWGRGYVMRDPAPVAAAA